MNFFKHFPRVQYTFQLDDTNVVMDITSPTTRIKLMERLKQNITVLYDYVIQDTDRPDTVATQLYGSPGHTWVILLVNNIFSLYDWPLTEAEFNCYIADKYGSIQAATTQYIYTTVDGYRVDATTWAALDVSDRGDTQTVYDWEVTLNEAKRRIKVIPPQFISPLMLELKKVLA